MPAVAYHHCGAWVYQLARPGGARIVLDAEAVPGGRWQPQPDGRTAVPADPAGRDGWGHAEHSCVPAGQETLL
jgi:hypothetical protein